MTREGIGMTSARTRSRMVERLREQGIGDEVVLSAMNAVPRPHLRRRGARHPRLRRRAAAHRQRPDDLAAVGRRAHDRAARNGRDLLDVLEIGTGCGYQTAVLAHIARHVYSVERIHALLRKGPRNLQSLKLATCRSSTATAASDLEGGARRRRDRRHGGATHVPTRCFAISIRRAHGAAARATGDERGTQRLTVLDATPAASSSERSMR
jgi:protein-L-isoaspartate(D-aspartate) O-methyltransferase